MFCLAAFGSSTRGDLGEKLPELRSSDGQRKLSKNLLYSLPTAVALVILTYFIGYQVDRSEFTFLISHYFLFFILYLLVCWSVNNKSTIFFFVGLSIILRGILVFAFPNLSDDIYRFIWDGHLIINQINPFDHLPSYYIEHTIPINGINEALYKQLNSPNYFTIYPPVNQIIFASAAYLSPNSWWGCSLVIKGFLFAFEIGSIWLIILLLQHFQKPLKNVLLYALNPLIIFEIVGNVHFEGAMIFFFLLGIWLLIVKQKLVLSAIAIALSIASKLLPLIFLPFFILRLSTDIRYRTPSRCPIPLLEFFKRIDWQRNLLFFSVIGGTVLLVFSPLLSGTFLSGFGSSLNLYFQKFEFNASIYYLLGWVGFQYKGYNIIHTLGPSLSILVLILIILKVLKEQQPSWNNLFENCLFAISLYLFFAMTVHPWYVALPIVCCLFTRFRFPILWSGLIFLTYINYKYAIYQENLWVVAIEYILVGIFVIYEVFKYRGQESGIRGQR